MGALTFNRVAGTQLYLADCTPTAPVVGYFVFSGSPPARISLLDSWQTYSGYYLLLDIAPADPAQFAQTLIQFFSGGTAGRGFLWVANPNDTTQPLNVITLPVGADQTTGAPATFNFRNNILLVGEKCPVTLDTDNNRFVIAQPVGDNNRIILQVDFGNSNLTDAIGPEVYLPLCGDGSGCLQFQLSLTEPYLDGDHLDAGLRYYIDDTSSPRPGFLLSQRYPLLGLSGGSVSLTANLDPLDAMSATRTYFSFTEQAGGGVASPGQIGSYFRTNIGQQVLLTPLPNAQFVFSANPQATQPDPNDPLYLVPSGDFLMSLSGGSPAAAAQTANGPHGSRLICGLGGNEYFDLEANIISFTSGSNAYIPNFPNGSSSATGGADPIQNNATTSWATIKSSAAAAVNYYAQPQQAELYASGFPSGGASSPASQDGNGGPEILGFLEVPAVTFSNGSPHAFPLAPYSGIENGSISLATVQALENQVFSPLRRLTLGYQGPAPSPSASLSTAPPANSTTPQGLLASVAGPNWTSLVLGQSDTGEQLLVNVGNTSGLQPALQTNQQFIVITNIAALAYFQSQVSIGGWTFDFSTQEEPPAGDYYNVLIFKFYNSSIESLAVNTQMWTNGSAFNVNSSDVSSWLSGYIQDAKDAVTGGNTRFQSFVDLVSDPSWNGVLGLNVYIPPGDLPSEVQGLLGGIDLSKFSAHHFGIETNSVGPNFSLIKSSLFALINYDNSGDTGAPPSGDYAFKVLTLQVVFSNSEITDFSSEIEVTIQNLFDVPASLGQSEKDPNSVILQGSYESHNGASTYSFTASGAYVFNLRSELITQVEFTKVQFTTVSSDQSSDLVTSTFSFWGSITFGTLADFDFFSFDDLAFADLSLSFTFDPSKVGTNKIPIQSFTFDPGDLRFDISISKARQDSLLGSFPLRLTGFTYASGGVSISDLGYLQIASPIGNLDGPVKYALGFELDLGSIGALASPLKGFAADIVAGWDPQQDGKVALGIKLPASSGGKLQIGIEGVLLLTIQNFEFTTLPARDSVPQRYVLYMHGGTLDVLGTNVPSSGAFSFVFFAPTGQSLSSALSNLGWFVAYSKGSESASLSEGDDGGGNGGDTLFQLSYLGLGQRVQVPGGLDDANTVSEVLDAMTTKLTPDLTGDALNEQLAEIYNPNGGWIVGGQFTILDTLTLGAVFVDPDLYGLLVGIAKGKLGPLGGFNFEILYKKVTDTIGVYQIQLTLPDYLRQLQFGEVSITIPVIGVDIYTNGNFKVDVGFPNGTDFSNSLTIQVFPFIGAGGFYYAQLSQGTATNVPTPSLGTFDPVLEFGFGLSLGVGKTINQGILSAGISVTFVGILEGTVAYWVPPGQSSGGAAVMFNKAPDYYAISGQVAIVGTLYGVVDFGIVKASLTVTISAGASLTWQAYQDLLLNVYAKVQVSLVVVIGGFKIFGIRIEIKISFSFSAEISYTWTIPDNRTPPWEQGLRFASVAMLLGGDLSAGPIQWSSITVNSTKVPISLFFSPQVTVAAPSQGATPQAQFVALLTVSTTATSGPSDFDNLASALLAWAVTLDSGSTVYDSTLPVTAESLLALSTLLSTSGTTVNDGPAPLNYQNITAFLLANFIGTIQDVPGSGASQNTTIFPMIPDLVLSVTGLSEIPFGQRGMVPSDYLQNIAEYFAMLLVNYDPSQSANKVAADSTQLSMATVIFQDYFALIIKAAVDQAYQTMSGGTGSPPSTLGTLLTSLQQSGGFSNVAAQAGRFLLHGLRLPQHFDLPQNQWAELQTQPLYQLVCQQVALTPVSTPSSVNDPAPTPSSFVAGAGLLSIDGFYAGYTLAFTSGALDGQSQTVSGYASATGRITVSAPFTQAPAQSDTFVLSAYAASSVSGPTAPTAGSFIGAAGLPVIDSYFVNYILTFTSGALNGSSSTVTSYQGSTLQITIEPVFSAVPAVGDAFVITPFAAGLSINTNPPPVNAWFMLSSANPPATTMAPGALATIQQLVTTTFSPDVTVQQSANLIQAPRNFALQRAIPWQLVDDSTSPVKVIDNWTICPFPSTLMDALAGTPLPQLTLMTGTIGSNDPPVVPPGLTYNWGTLVNLSLQQIPTTGGAFLPNTYQVGGTDETGRNLIFDLLNQLNSVNPPQIDNIYLLFQPQQQGQSSGLVSETIVERSASVLMKVNLSTESAPPSQAVARLALMATQEPPADDFSAMMDQYSGFLRLVWECSIVNADGYYFYYESSNEANSGLPAYLFSAGTTAQVSLLVTFDGAAVAGYNNCVVVTDPGTPSNQGQVFFAEVTNILEWRPALAAGSVAFNVTAADPSTLENASDDTVQLLSLFNLLTYQIEGNGTFNTSMRGLPVGPTDSSGSVNTTTWNYQQGVSVYPWFNTGGGPENQSPYSGIGNNVELSFALLDLFGNEMPTASPLPSLTANYLFFDDLIPVTSWSGVRASYLCTSKSGASTLEVTLAFEGSVFQDITTSSVSDAAPGESSFKGASTLSSVDDAYAGGTLTFTSGALAGQSSTVTGYAGATREITVSPAFSEPPVNDDAFSIAVWNVQRAAQAQEFFQLIGYQLGGPGVTITLATSLAAEVVTSVAAGQFTGQSGLVAGILGFLQAIVSGNSNPPALPPLVLQVPISIADREANTNNIFEVTVALTIERDPKLVDPSVNSVQPGITPPLPLSVSSPIPPQVGNTVTSSVTGATTASSFSGGSELSDVDDFYLGGIVTFSSGTLTGQTSSVTGYTGAAHTISISPPFSGAPADSDTFTLTPKMTLVPFAEEFEQAFPELRAATGLGSAGPLSVWAVRIGSIQPGNEGISVAINSGNPTFFAPKPLSNTLLSRPDANHPDPVLVMPYTSGGPDPSMVSMNFAGVDLDVFARSFLSAVDEFLSPGMAVPARQLNSDYYLAVITAKQALAEQISLGVTQVLETTGSVSGAATTTSFEAAAAPDLATTDGSYVGSTLTFTSGALAGTQVAIASYTGATREITVSSALSSPPGAGDGFSITPGSSALSAAQGAFKQRLLVTLASDYNAGSIVQYPASVATTGAEEAVPPNLYGQMIGTSSIKGTTQDFSLSTAKVPLSTEGSLLTFLFDSLTNEANASLDMQYHVTHIERDISATSGPDEFTSSSWLTLITNDAAGWPVGNSMPVGDAAIPVPLRAYPTPPALLQQQALQGPSEHQASADDTVTLASQRLWHYSYRYQQAYVPQDTIGANIQFNVPLSQQQNARLMVTEPDLFDWLARFSYEYLLMQADLAKIPTAAPNDSTALYAMKRFAELIWGTAFGMAPMPPSPPPPPASGPWAQWVAGGKSPLLGAALGGTPLTQYQYGYQIEEETPQQNAAGITLIADDPSYPYPDIEIQLDAGSVSGNAAEGSFDGDVGLSSADGSYVGSTLTFISGTLTRLASEITGYTGASRNIVVSPPFSLAPGVGDAFVIQILLEPTVQSGSATYQYSNPNPSNTLIRTLVFNNRDVMSTENAWGGIQLARNKVLVDGITTNPEFVYQTPIVRFVNKVTPLLDSDKPVNIAQIENNNPVSTLEYFLCVLFKALFAPSGTAGNADETGARTIRVECTYGYDIRSGQDTNEAQAVMVYVPVALALPFGFDLSTDVGQDCTVAPAPESFVYTLGQAIRTWFSGYGPSTNGGVFTFDISVFAGLSQTNLPVLRLRDLFLEYRDIQPPLA